MEVAAPEPLASPTSSSSGDPSAQPGVSRCKRVRPPHSPGTRIPRSKHARSTTRRSASCSFPTPFASRVAKWPSTPLRLHCVWTRSRPVPRGIRWTSRLHITVPASSSRVASRPVVECPAVGTWTVPRGWHARESRVAEPVSIRQNRARPAPSFRIAARRVSTLVSSLLATSTHTSLAGLAFEHAGAPRLHWEDRVVSSRPPDVRS